MASLVEDEIAGTVRIAANDDFLTTLLLVDVMEVAATRRELDNKQKHGINALLQFGFDGAQTRRPNSEKALCEPFVNAANSIIACSKNLKVHSYWATQADNEPPSTDEMSAQIRPNAVCVLGDQRLYSRALDMLSSLQDQPEQPVSLNTLTELLQAVCECAQTHLGYHYKQPVKRTVDRVIGDGIDSAEIPDNFGSGDMYAEEIHSHLHEAHAALVELKTPGKGEFKDYISDGLAQPIRCIKGILEVLHRTLPLEQANMEFLLKKDRGTVSTPSEADVSQLEKLVSIWWLRVNTPVAINPGSTLQERKDGSVQLCRHMRQVLANQLDRQFVFGLLICDHYLRVFFCDRSGMLVTEMWMDIREDPDTFIRVIMALSSLSTPKLGWDQTMKLRLGTEDGLVFTHSTDPRVKIKDYGTSAYDTEWAILVPNANYSDQGTWYPTIRALSLTWSEVMVGRATVVWLVKELGADTKELPETDPKSRLRLVLKQSWIQSGCPTERELHGEGEMGGVGYVEASVNVGRKTVKDNGDDAVRGDIIGQPCQWDRGLIESDKLKTQKKAADRDQVLHVAATPVNSMDENPESHLASRVLTRTLIRTYGWSIKFYKDLEELLTVIRDAVLGHRNLYFQCKVLHGDISTGNILICPKGDGTDVVNTHGQLIDLDHAKRANKRIEYNPSPSFSDLEVVIRKAGISSDTAKRLLRRFQGGLTGALIFTKHLNRSSSEGGVQSEVLRRLRYPTDDHYKRWETEEHRPPSWQDSSLQVRPGVMTGTPAFMSYEIYTGNVYQAARGLRTDIFGNKTPIHTAIQDIESFFWVLLYLCLTRDGPGGARRSEFTGDTSVGPSDTNSRWLELPAGFDSDDNARHLRDIVRSLFDDKNQRTIAESKEQLFNSRQRFEDTIQTYFHPYFDPLKPLLSKWWTLLHDGYDFYDDVKQGTIDDELLDLLDEELKNITSSERQRTPDADEVERMNAEVERRKQDISFHWGMPLQPSPSCKSPVLERQGSPVQRTAAQADLVRARRRRSESPADEPPEAGPSRKRAKHEVDEVSGEEGVSGASSMES